MIELKEKTLALMLITMLIIGFLLGIYGATPNRNSIIISKQKLIEQNLAEYDSKTGEFKLKIEVK